MKVQVGNIKRAIAGYGNHANRAMHRYQVKQAIRAGLPERGAALRRAFPQKPRFDYLPHKVDDDCLQELRWSMTAAISPKCGAILLGLLKGRVNRRGLRQTQNYPPSRRHMTEKARRSVDHPKPLGVSWRRTRFVAAPIGSRHAW